MEIIFYILKGMAIALSEIFPLSARGLEYVFALASSVVEGIDKSGCFIVAAESGALAAVVLKMYGELFKYFGILASESGKIIRREKAFSESDGKELLFVIWMIVPLFSTFLIQEFFSQVYNKNSLSVVVAFFVSGVIVVMTDFLKKEDCPCDENRLSGGFLAGVFRMLGFVPGISGTGGMLFSAHLCGIPRESAYKYVILLCIPVYAGRILLRVKNGAFAQLGASDTAGCVITFALSFAAVYYSIDILKKMHKEKKLSVFSVILFILALFTLLLWMRG